MGFAIFVFFISAVMLISILDDAIVRGRQMTAKNKYTVVFTLKHGTRNTIKTSKVSVDVKANNIQRAGAIAPDKLPNKLQIDFYSYYEIHEIILRI